MRKWWEWLRSLIRRPSREAELEPIKLDGSSTQALSISLQRLSPGQDGWITIEEARRLFSADTDDATALTMFDPNGLRALSEFAADAQHRSRAHRPDGRVNFRRLSTFVHTAHSAPQRERFRPSWCPVCVPLLKWSGLSRRGDFERRGPPTPREFSR
jgi:hypothetical protein